MLNLWDLAAERGGSLDIGRNARTRRNALKQVGCVEAGWLLLSFAHKIACGEVASGSKKAAKTSKLSSRVRQASSAVIIHPSMMDEQFFLWANE